MGPGREDAVRSEAAGSSVADAPTPHVASIPLRVDKRTVLAAQFLLVAALSALPPASAPFTALLVGAGAYLAFGPTRLPTRFIPAKFLLRAK